MNLQDLLDRHNIFKAKWLQLNEQDLFDWIVLLEEFLDARVEYRSTYSEDKQQLEVEKGMKRIALKSQLDAKGKKIHTEWTADAIINELFYDKDKLLAATKLSADLVDNKCQVIEQYVNIVKMKIKK